jgi:hypothetical protein
MTKSPSDSTSPVNEKFNPINLNENDHATKLRDYIDRLHPSAQADLLDKLHLLDKTSAARINPSDENVAKNLWATSLAPPVDPILTTNDDDDADRNAATFTRIMNAGGLCGNSTIPSHQLCSGFKLTLSSRDDKDIAATSGMVQANVGQKHLKRHILRRFFLSDIC